MSETKRVTIPIDGALKEKLEKIAVHTKRSYTANLAYALEVFAALFDDEGRMKCSIDSILLGQLPNVNPVNHLGAPAIPQTTTTTSVVEVAKEVPVDNEDASNSISISPGRVRAKRI